MKSVGKLLGGAVIALGAIAFLGASGAHANSIVNGSFESPVITFSWYENYGTFTGDLQYGGLSFDSNWAITTNNVDIVSSLTAGGNAPAANGNQYLDLVGTGSTGGIAQTFTTVPGTKYNVTFAYGNNPWSTSTASALMTVFDGSSNILLSAFTHTTSGSSNINWTVYSGSFTADSNSSILSFLETVGSGNGGVLLDAVNISATPLPATWTMMLLGFVGFGFFAYRGTKKLTALAAA